MSGSSGPSYRISRPRDPVVWEYTTKTRRHLALDNVGHTACGRSVAGMEVVEQARFPWNWDMPLGCGTCWRVMNSGGLGFWVTPRGTILTRDFVCLREPVQVPEQEPGIDAMHWYPLDD
jgi:hypothetical protein